MQNRALTPYPAAGLPTLVLLPGMDGTGALFAPLLAALAGRCATRVLRYPGDRVLGYPALQTLVAAQLHGLGPCVLVGESFSGPLAIMLAAQAELQVQGLVLCSTFACNPRPMLQGPGALFTALPAALLPRPPALLWSPLLLGRFATPALQARIAEALHQVQPAVLQARLRSVLGVDVSQVLQHIQVPCLYLQASHDRLVPATAALHMQGLLAAMHIQTLTGPHCLLQTAPEAAAQVLLAFLEGLDRPQPVA